MPPGSLVLRPVDQKVGQAVRALIQFRISQSFFIAKTSQPSLGSLHLFFKSTPNEVAGIRFSYRSSRPATVVARPRSTAATARWESPAVPQRPPARSHSRQESARPCRHQTNPCCTLTTPCNPAGVSLSESVISHFAHLLSTSRLVAVTPVRFRGWRGVFCKINIT